jgi:hypothetical protein
VESLSLSDAFSNDVLCSKHVLAHIVDSIWLINQFLKLLVLC